MVRSAAALLVGLATMGSAAAAQLAVHVEGADPAGGIVLVGICSGSLDFGSCGYSQRIQPPSGEFRVLFQNLPEGTYAIAAFQDTNGNNALDRAPNGLPLEPYAFSNGTGRTAPPSFEAARIAVTGDTLARIRLMRSPLAR
ncbi:DUF2141 domain-containing protein [Microvirga arsenatis]|uniref:DUF2141 domain-containing protein n=1 Tax=Microvirga arsenatis TaxID=2692265 RepID=A0ABW9Z058_9HYPH|nr:DUF2141 domain-containing protein [Microvirga arsenatis]NBJ11983.1 DUF2141 domain-containing protein [Microvirga arsenatis]NBJ26026.1 DUF2141 domain-containing protein [Microvirga arsenatis]